MGKIAVIRRKLDAVGEFEGLWGVSGYMMIDIVQMFGSGLNPCLSQS